MDKHSHFDQLLEAAAAEPEPQRLLFVFATAELPDDATPAQRQNFAAGGGGTLTPLMCVDKGTDELASFDQLVAESRKAGPPWHVVFTAGLSGRNGQQPSAQQVERALEAMLERVRGGMIGSLLALDPSGEALHFTRVESPVFSP
ncbi:MAG: ribonucleotide reductase subunit alpha [Pseudomonadota bacterium]|nr:ribonucleotide reductase subunit alpha [Pseudomonadota bacterium]